MSTSKIYITGDMHRQLDKFSIKYFPEGQELTKNDYVIVCGDFGFVWDCEPTRNENYLLDWLDNLPWVTLFVDG